MASYSIISKFQSDREKLISRLGQLLFDVKMNYIRQASILPYVNEWDTLYEEYADPAKGLSQSDLERIREEVKLIHTLFHLPYPLIPSKPAPRAFDYPSEKELQEMRKKYPPVVDRLSIDRIKSGFGPILEDGWEIEQYTPYDEYFEVKFIGIEGKVPIEKYRRTYGENSIRKEGQRYTLTINVY